MSIYIYIWTYVYMFIYIYIYMCVCVCVVGVLKNCSWNKCCQLNVFKINLKRLDVWKKHQAM